MIVLGKVDTSVKIRCGVDSIDNKNCFGRGTTIFNTKSLFFNSDRHDFEALRMIESKLSTPLDSLY